MYNADVDDEFEWDPRKAQTNLAKHGVAFADAATIFDDERAITLREEYPEEDRFVTVAMDALGRLLVVAYTWRGETIRIISARKATRTEERAYRGIS